MISKGSLAILFVAFCIGGLTACEHGSHNNQSSVHAENCNPNLVGPYGTYAFNGYAYGYDRYNHTYRCHRQYGENNWYYRPHHR